MRAAASDEGGQDEVSYSRNGKAHRMKETQQDEDDIVQVRLVRGGVAGAAARGDRFDWLPQNNSGEDGVAFQLDPQALHRALGDDEAGGQRERDAARVLLRRIPSSSSSSSARRAMAPSPYSPRSYDEPGQEVRLSQPIKIVVSTTWKYMEMASPGNYLMCIVQ